MPGAVGNRHTRIGRPVNPVALTSLRYFQVSSNAHEVPASCPTRERFERAFDETLSNGCGVAWEIIAGGSLGGRWPLADARVSMQLLLRASVPAGQGSCSNFTDVLSVYGKEKVYGSIP